MKYLSVCSGIEAASVAWQPLGWEAVGFSEIEKFPSQVLAHHYPDVTNFGDMTKYKEWNLDTVNLLVGGTPCQSFSVAGLRKGLEDPRGNLALTYCGILDHFRPQWFVWENVPGVLSSGGGRDFGSFLGAVAELGYGFAYRVLDAQYFGVAQRRRRVFVVGHLGDWRPATEVLFEPESLRRNIKKGRSEGKEVAATITARFGNSRNNHEELAPIWPANTASTLNASFGNKLGLENQHINSGAPLFVPTVYETHPADSRVKEMGDVCQTVTSSWGTGGGNVPIALAENTIGRQPQNGGNGDGFTEGGPMYTLNATGVHGVAQPIPLNTMTMMGRPSDDGRMGSGIGSPGDPCPTITKAHSHAVAQPVAYSFDSLASNSMKSSNPHSGCREVNLAKTLDTTTPEPSKNQGGIGIIQQMAVRRLTPVECERLQGFPENYTDIKPKGKETPDGPRYKALGNSMAVPVMAWIGKRIAEYQVCH